MEIMCKNSRIGLSLYHKEIVQQRSYAEIKNSDFFKDSNETWNSQSECFISAQYSNPILFFDIRSIKTKQLYPSTDVRHPNFPFLHHVGDDHDNDSNGLQNNNPKILFKIPRVLPNHRHIFDTDDFFRKHLKEGEVRSSFTSVNYNPRVVIWAIFQSVRLQSRKLRM